jgi:hypothetical protein
LAAAFATSLATFGSASGFAAFGSFASALDAFGSLVVAFVSFEAFSLGSFASLVVLTSFEDTLVSFATLLVSTEVTGSAAASFAALVTLETFSTIIAFGDLEILEPVSDADLVAFSSLLPRGFIADGDLTKGDEKVNHSQRSRKFS